MNIHIFRKPLEKIKSSYIVVFTCLAGLSLIAFFYTRYSNTLSQQLSSQATKNMVDSTDFALKSEKDKINAIFSNMEQVLIHSPAATQTSFTESEMNIYLSDYNATKHLGHLTYRSKVYVENNIMPDMTNSERIQMQSLLNGSLHSFAGFQIADYSMALAIPVQDQSQHITGVLFSFYSTETMADIVLWPSDYRFGFVSITTNDPFSIFMDDTGTLSPVTDLSPDFGNLTQYLSSNTSYNLEKEAEIWNVTLHDTQYYCQYTLVGKANLLLLNFVPVSEINSPSQALTEPAARLAQQIVAVFLIVALIMFSFYWITEYNIRSAKDQLSIESKRYQLVLDHTPDALWEYNILTDCITKTDPDLGIYTGETSTKGFRQEYLRRKLIHPDDIVLFNDIFMLMAQKEPLIKTELRAKNISGDYIWFRLTANAITNSENEVVSYIGQTIDIHQEKMELEALREANQKDPLTQLYNRNAISLRVDEAIYQEMNAMIHALCVIDIHNFKTINETYGHMFGDAVLIALSSKLRKYYPDPNLCGRIGGDEFILFLYNLPSMDFAREEVKRIINIFQNICIDYGNQTTLTGSVGVSVFPNDGTDFESLLSKADTALYYAHMMGDNHYAFYSKDSMSDAKTAHIDWNPIFESHIHSNSKTLIDTGLIGNAIDILFDAKNIDSSLNMILTLIGNAYNLDSISIMETSLDEQNLEVSYEWIADSMKAKISPVVNIPITSEDVSFFHLSNNVVFYTSNVTTIAEKSPLCRKKYLDGLSAVFQCLIMDQGQYCGAITCASYSPDREWTPIEIDTLSLFSKILSAHLIKMRSQKLADSITLRDSLTKAYNLFPFTKEAAKIVQSHPENQYALAYMDIDKFNYINETYGYKEGDYVLISFANTIESILHEGELFARVNSDKFVALIAIHPGEDYQEVLSRRLMRELDAKMKEIPRCGSDTDFHRIYLVIGVNLVDRKYNMSLNIDRANTARKNIVIHHKSKMEYFDEKINSHLTHQLEVEEVMEKALLNEEFLVYYQPKFDLKKNRICAAEALIRWERPGIGLVPPNDFIPIFENNGFIVEVDYYVYEHVCRKIRELLDQNIPVVPISINFSRIHVSDPHFIERLTAPIKHYRIPTKLLVIELTESALVEEKEGNNTLLSLLNEIHRRGFQLSMDDFGSGMSSLNLLRTMPFDELKLDKDFFQEGSANRRERIVIKNIVHMATELNMTIVSEGVETEEQAKFLRDIHCQVAQGYLFDRPLPEEVFIEKYLGSQKDARTSTT
ncbi:MAG: EAL domain-containing protein [Clostridiales bacterium]|nr:EAL domain-containing protein [Clostridiales bacterium]